jgi:hypothetical protein
VPQKKKKIKKKRKKGAGGMAQAVKRLPSKQEALTSNSSTGKKIRRDYKFQQKRARYCL